MGTPPSSSSWSHSAAPILHIWRRLSDIQYVFLVQTVLSPTISSKQSLPDKKPSSPASKRASSKAPSNNPNKGPSISSCPASLTGHWSGAGVSIDITPGTYISTAMGRARMIIKTYSQPPWQKVHGPRNAGALTDTNGLRAVRQHRLLICNLVVLDNLTSLFCNWW